MRERRSTLKDTRKAEGRNGGVQTEALPWSTGAVRGRDAMAHTVSLLFSPQVPEAKQEELCLYLVPLEQMDFQGPQVLKGPKVLFRVLLYLEIEL